MYKRQHQYEVRPEGEIRVYDAVDAARVTAVLSAHGVAVAEIYLHEMCIRDRYKGHAAEHVHGAELVVYTAAILSGNPEIEEAQRCLLYTSRCV